MHVVDRESDIYELFCLAQDLRAEFLVRVQTNRLAERPADAAPHDPAHRVFAQLAAGPSADIIALPSMRMRRPGFK